LLNNAEKSGHFTGGTEENNEKDQLGWPVSGWISGAPRLTSYKYRVEQRKRVFFKWLVLDKGGVDDVGRQPADSLDNAVSVAMAHWNAEHRVLAVEQFFLETVIP